MDIKFKSYSHHPHLFDAFKAFCDEVDAQRGQPGYKNLHGAYRGEGVPDGHDLAEFWVGLKGGCACDVLDTFSYNNWLKQQGGTHE